MAKKVKLKISSRLLKKRTKKFNGNAGRQCRFCGKKELQESLDYKNTFLLRNFLTERGKILPSRISGNCCLHQRELARQIRKARTMALLPYTAPLY